MKKVKISLILVLIVILFSNCQPARVDGGAEVDTLSLVQTKAKILCNRDYYPVVYSLFDNAKKSIYGVIYNINYYTYDNEVNKLLDRLIVANEKGVDVKILLEQSDWNADVTNSNYTVGEKLQSYGINVRYDPLTLTTHCKLFIIDSIYVVVGSTNWTISALNSNNEANTLLEGKEISKDFIDYFQLLWENSFDRR